MKIGVVGISGLVGQEIITSFQLLDISTKYKNLEFYFYGSNNSNGKKIKYNNKEYIIQEFLNEYLEFLDICILAVDNNIAKKIINYVLIRQPKCYIIDNSSEFRLHEDVPLVIPEINKDTITLNKKIIANPNCTTTLLDMILFPLLKINNIKINRMNISTYQAASGAGINGLSELETQMKEYVNNNGEIKTMTYWNKEYAMNVFSHNSPIDLTNLHNQEELKVIKETKKILGVNIPMSITCMRVCTIRSHILTVNIEFNRDINYTEIINVLTNSNGIFIFDDHINNRFPEPVICQNKPEIFVGRIRHNLNDHSRWNFIICGDQILKGAAYNSVQIMCELINKLNNHSVSKL